MDCIAVGYHGTATYKGWGWEWSHKEAAHLFASPWHASHKLFIASCMCTNRLRSKRHFLHDLTLRALSPCLVSPSGVVDAGHAERISPRRSTRVKRVSLRSPLSPGRPLLLFLLFCPVSRKRPCRRRQLGDYSVAQVIDAQDAQEEHLPSGAVLSYDMKEVIPTMYRWVSRQSLASRCSRR